MTSTAAPTDAGALADRYDEMANSLDSPTVGPDAYISEKIREYRTIAAALRSSAPQETWGDEPVGMREALHDLAIKQHVRMAHGGGFVNNGRSCAVCKGEWADDAPEFHALTCPLAASQQSPRLEREGLEVAFRPFADFMSATLFDKLSDETRLTAGSPMARRQLTIGDLRKLSDAILALLSPADVTAAETRSPLAKTAP